MTKKSLLSLTVVAMAVAAAVTATSADSAGPNCIRLTAAFKYLNKVYLISGYRYFEIDSNFNQVDAGLILTKFRGLPGSVDAALEFPGNNKLTFFQGNYYFEFIPQFNGFAGSRLARDWLPFFAGGIDAAGSINGKSYFFKGREYITVVGDTNSPAAEISNLGLPNDIYAAWEQGDKLYIVKGSNYWTMDANEQVTGPHSLPSLLKLHSASICNELTNPFVEKLNAEQKYERENSCVVIDAAVTWSGTVHLFNDDEFITLDDQGMEGKRGRFGEWVGFPTNVDAALVWPADGRTYYFSGPNYYQSFTDYTGSYVTIGPYVSEQWSPYLTNGADAAVSLRGTSYIFKGCDILKLDGPSRVVSSVLTSADMGLECNVDAAFSRADVFYVIKANTIWRCQSDKCSSPLLLANELTLMSWKVCPPRANPDV